jgi:uncharacterized protein YdaU (DUF1376 family)
MASKRDDVLRGEWFWCDRWPSSPAFLLPLEHRGLHREMLTAAWVREGRLPNDPEAIQRAAGVTAKEWKASWPRVQRFWRIDGDHLVNDEQLEVYAAAKAHQEAKSRRAKAGAAARWHKGDPVVPEHMPEQVPKDMPEHMLKHQPEQLLTQCPPSPSSTTSNERTPRTRRLTVAGQWRRALAIAHRVIETSQDHTSQSEHFKQLCAEQGIDYATPGPDGRALYARALDAVEEIRRHRAPRPMGRAS